MRAVMRAEGATDLSEDACRLWARRLVQQYAPGWLPGTPLHWMHVLLVGASFNARLHAARGERDRLGWMKR